MVIPFNKPHIVGNELLYIQEAIASGHLSGDGGFSKRCHALLEESVGVPKALLTPSCTHALEMSAILANIVPGDEVILPSFTFVSTVNAFVLRGAIPVFIDVRPDTLNFDERFLEQLITKKTKVLVVVHYAGVACEMDEIMAIAARHNIMVIEDNAHGLYGSYKGKQLGTFGTFATQSFHETKNFQSGEGGALLINDEAYIERAEIIREKGTNRSLFFRGQVDKYTWVDVGSSFLPSELQAAYLAAQLEERDKIQAKRKKIWDTYDSDLAHWAEQYGVQQPTVPDYCEQTYHMYYILLPDLETRQRLITHLKSFDIQAVFHYLPLHLSKKGKEFGGKLGDCVVTEKISDQLLRLPFFYDLKDEEQEKVIEVLQEFSF